MPEAFPATYAEWLDSVPEEICQDTLWRLEAYRFAVFMGDLAWRDIGKLAKDRRMIALSDQLYRAVGSIGANVAEGYSRQPYSTTFPSHDTQHGDQETNDKRQQSNISD